MIISVLVTMFSESKYESFFSISEPIQITVLIIITEISIMVSIVYVKMMKERKNRQNKIKNERLEEYRSNLKNKKISSINTNQKAKHDSIYRE